MALPARGLIRWQGHAYDDGWHFITIRVGPTSAWLSHIHRSEVILTQLGKMGESALLALHDPDKGVFLDEYVLMPDHLHAIICLQPGHTTKSPPVNADPVARSLMRLSRLIGKFKMRGTQEVKISHGKPGSRFWQNRFHDRVISNEKELNAIRNHIRQNPARAKPL